MASQSLATRRKATPAKVYTYGGVTTHRKTIGGRGTRGQIVTIRSNRPIGNKEATAAASHVTRQFVGQKIARAYFITPALAGNRRTARAVGRQNARYMGTNGPTVQVYRTNFKTNTKKGTNRSKTTYIGGNRRMDYKTQRSNEAAVGKFLHGTNSRTKRGVGGTVTHGHLNGHHGGNKHRDSHGRFA